MRQTRAQPAQAGAFFGIEPGRVPDRHAGKVRAIRIGIADTLNDRQSSALEQLGCACHGRVQPDAVCDLEQPVGGKTQRFSISGVPFVVVGNNGIDSVIASVELDDDQHATVFLGPRRPPGAHEETGDRSGQ